MVGEDVRVSGHDRVADLNGPPFAVKGGADEVNNRYAGGEPERLDLGGRGHTGADLLVEVVEVVAEFFEAGVDAAGTRIGLSDLRPASNVERQIRGSELNRLPVQQIPPPTNKHPPHRTKPRGDVLTGFLLLDLKTVDLRMPADGIRLNSSGTDLSTFDLMVAATWSKGFDLNEKVEEISYSLEPKNYGEIKGTTALKCLSVVQYESANRERVIAPREFKGDQQKMDSLVDRTQKALLRAVDQLATDFKIYSLSFLPYEAHLVILTYIYANNPNLSAQALRRVRQWFWRTSFSERYRGAPDDFVTRDLLAIKNFVLEDEDGGEEIFGTGLTSTEIKKWCSGKTTHPPGLLFRPWRKITQRI